MKKVTLLFVMMAILLPFCSALCQDLNDYIDQIKGDTLVIKDYFDLDEKAGSLYEVMHLDKELYGWDLIDEDTKDLKISDVIDALDQDLGRHFFPPREDGSDSRVCSHSGAAASPTIAR